MAFRFPLDSLLHAREALERQEELLLAAAQQEAARIRTALEECRDRQFALRRAQNEALGQAASGAELQFTAERQRSLRALEQQLSREQAASERRRAERQAAYQRARTERRAIEALREQAAAAYLRDHARKEQQSLDETHLQRRYRRGGR